MYKRISDFLNLNNILVGEQFGFRKNLSTNKALFSFTDKILSALNNKMHVGGISCDLTKAVDCVNHELLLSKLNFYGIQNIAGQRFKSYLHYRKQRVEIQQIQIIASTQIAALQNMELLKVQYLVLCFLSYISMICPQPSTLSLNLYSLPMILMLLFHSQKLFSKSHE
jgi:hypothetical protein